jgi:cyclophilin family peptidyl-prolyl cis-trans isomerase
VIPAARADELDGWWRSRVEDGFYDGIEVHRVEPVFVIQGGDPTGSGSESSDDLIREGISSLEHHRATVGIATAGTHTGWSQFFVNHTSNLHLDGRITIVAEVVAGWTSWTASRWATRSCQPRHSDPDVSEAVEQGTAVWYAAPGEMSPP